MKVLIIIVLFASAITFSEQRITVQPQYVAYWKQLLSPVTNDCLTESGATKEELHGILIHKEYPDSQPIACFFKCAAKKLQLADADGKLNVAGLVAGTGLTKQLVEKCNVQKADPCETAYERTKCLYSNGAELVALPKKP